MLMSPSKLQLQRILKNRTLNFETVRKTHGNMVFVATSSEKDMHAVLSSKLFRPQQMMASFVPRMIRPMGKKNVRVDQKEEYSKLKLSTSGRIVLGKISMSAYGGRNIAYNMVPEYSLTSVYAEKMKTGAILQRYMTDYMETLISSRASEANYDESHIVFPLVEYIEDFKQKVWTKLDPLEPIVLFLKSVLKGTVNRQAYSRFKRVIFYNPKANAMVAFDLSTMDDKDFTDVFLKIDRLNKFNGGEDSLTQDVLDESDEELDEEEELENTKEKIKEVVLGKVSKTLGAKLTDFEAADKDEKDLILAIDKKIESYLRDPKNADRPFEELTGQIESDQEVKIKSLKYVETKKIAEQKLSQLSRNLEKEVEALSSIDEMSEDYEETLEPDTFENEFIDERVKSSSLSNFDEEYNKKQAPKDLKNIISSFSNSSYLPLTVEKLTVEDTSDDFNQKDTVSIRYKNDEGKTLSVAIDVPKIVDKRYFYLNGNKKAMTKQLFRLPIVKTKPDRVEITTNFNKVTIERTNGKVSRKNAYFLKLIEDYKNNPNFKIEYGANGIANSNFKSDFEYEELGESLTSIETVRYVVLFNRDDMKKELSLVDLPDDFIKDGMTPIALSKPEGYVFYIRGLSVYRYPLNGNDRAEEKVADSFFDFLMVQVLERDAGERLPQIGKSFIYTKMSILGTTYPVFAVVGILNGLTDILRRYGVEYKVSESKLPRDGQFVEVAFRDKYLYYRDTVRNTLLLNVLYAMNTEEYDYSDFDMDKPYLDFFIDRLDQPIYIKNTLKINMGVIVDPITRDVLNDLKLPTDIVDLLLLANTMLMNNAYRPQNDVRNYRVRSNEVVFAMMYQILADAYIRYQRARLNGRTAATLDVPRNVLITSLGKEPNVNDHSTLNPVLEMETIATISAKGFRGINLDDAYTLEVRAYDETMVGFISPNSTPQGNAGVARALTYNPKITSVRGYIPDVDRSTLDPANVLSPAEMLQSFTSTQADPMRQSMQIGQTKHTMPVVKTHKQLVGSGVNKTMAYMISDDFAFKAKEDGVVEKIDEENKLAILAYKSGKKDAIDLAEFFVKNSNGGFYIRQQFTMKYREGERFKARDVLAYNPSFFSGKGKDIDYQPGTLAKVAIAAGDFAYEDSTIISETVAKKAASLVTMLKQVALGQNAVVHKMAEIGDKVKAGDSILDFTTSFEDPSTTDFLASLTRSLGSDVSEAVGNESIKTKYSGTVANIKIYYNKPMEELNDSLQKIIKKYKGKVQKRKAALGGIKTASVHIPPLEQQKADSDGTSRVGAEDYEGVLIEFYVEYYDEMGEGDKLVYSTALKGVISQVLSKEESPVSEHRRSEHIEAIITPTGIISRMTADIYSMLYANKVLIELGKQIKEIMDGEE
jgi:hypothetical protein